MRSIGLAVWLLVCIPVFAHCGSKLLFNSEVKPWYKRRKDGTVGREVVLHLRSGQLSAGATVTIRYKGQEQTTEWSRETNPDSLGVLLPAGIGVTEAFVKIIARANNDS